VRERRDQCALLLAYTTGLRRAELASLTEEQLSCERGASRPLGYLERNRWIYQAGTRECFRYQPTVTTALHEYLSNRRPPSDPRACRQGTPLLADARGVRPLTAHGLTMSSRSCSSEPRLSWPLKIQPQHLGRATTHWLRHSYAVHALDSGVDFRDLQGKAWARLSGDDGCLSALPAHSLN